jgi:hypothetical protein
MQGLRCYQCPKVGRRPAIVPLYSFTADDIRRKVAIRIPMAASMFAIAGGGGGQERGWKLLTRKCANFQRRRIRFLWVANGCRCGLAPSFAGWRNRPGKAGRPESKSNMKAWAGAARINKNYNINQDSNWVGRIRILY